MLWIYGSRETQSIWAKINHVKILLSLWNMTGNIVHVLNKNQRVDESKWVRFIEDVYKNSFFLWQDMGKYHRRYTWQKLSVYAPCITINTLTAVLLKLWKVVWHFRWLVFASIYPFRSDIVIWSGFLSASVRPDHNCGYSYLEIQKSQMIRV